MPYITKEGREVLLPELESLITEFTGADSIQGNEGNFNFVVSTLINAMIEEHGLSYANVNSLVGVLECIKLELYRRIAVPYEDLKIIQNGDVYGSQN